MKRALVVSAIGLVLLSAGTAMAQERSSRLRLAQPDVAAKYESLRTLSKRDLRPEWVQLTPAMKSGIWTLHLTQFLDDHPELTAEQRSVVFEALGLIASGALEVDYRSPEYATRVLEPARQLERRARTLLPNELVREALLQLSPAAEPAGPGGFKVASQNTCHCRISAGGEDCGWSGTCVQDPNICAFYPYCGPMMMEACDGICG